ncbi:MAG: hypothetical protein WCS90_02175 [Bacilli bacterium]
MKKRVESAELVTTIMLAISPIHCPACLPEAILLHSGDERREESTSDW